MSGGLYVNGVRVADVTGVSIVRNSQAGADRAFRNAMRMVRQIRFRIRNGKLVQIDRWTHPNARRRRKRNRR
jgi:hypothetical protein